MISGTIFIKRTYSFGFFLAILLLYSCKPVPKEQTNYDSFFKNLPFHNADSLVLSVSTDVPPNLQGMFAERIYYMLKEGTPYAFIYRYLDLCEQKIPHDTVLIFTNFLKGKHLMREGKYDSALVYIMHGYELSQKTHSTYRMADTKSLLGDFYLRQANYPEAIKNLLDAHSLYSSVVANDNPAIYEIMLNISQAYRYSRDYQSAQYWDICLRNMVKNLEESNGYHIKSTSALAHDYLYCNQLDSAQIFIDMAFFYQNRYQNYYDEAYRISILAEIQLLNGDCDLALNNFLKANRINVRKNDLIRINNFKKRIGDGYFCQGKRDSAIYYYTQALVTPDTACQADIHKSLADIYGQKKLYDLAYQHEQISRKLSDKIFTIDKNREITQLKVEKEVEKKEKEWEKTKNKAKVMGLSMLFVLLLLILFIFVILLRLRYQYQKHIIIVKEKELVEIREKIKILELEHAKKKITVQYQELEESVKQLSLKDELIEALKMKVNRDVSPEKIPLEKDQLKDLKILTAEEWRNFRMIFEKHNPNFIAKIIERFPKITTSDIRLLVLIQIGFDASEKANLLGVSVSSIYTSRYRLRKKLGLLEEEDLEVFINGL